jgi:hypothetical protein
MPTLIYFKVVGISYHFICTMKLAPNSNIFVLWMSVEIEGTPHNTLVKFCKNCSILAKLSNFVKIIKFFQKCKMLSIVNYFKIAKLQNFTKIVKFCQYCHSIMGSKVIHTKCQHFCFDSHLLHFCQNCEILSKLWNFVQTVKFCPNCQILSNCQMSKL